MMNKDSKGGMPAPKDIFKEKLKPRIKSIGPIKNRAWRRKHKK